MQVMDLLGVGRSHEVGEAANRSIISMQTRLKTRKGKPSTLCLRKKTTKCRLRRKTTWTTGFLKWMPLKKKTGCKGLPVTCKFM